MRFRIVLWVGFAWLGFAPLYSFRFEFGILMTVLKSSKRLNCLADFLLLLDKSSQLPASKIMGSKIMAHIGADSIRVSILPTTAR